MCVSLVSCLVTTPRSNQFKPHTRCASPGGYIDQTELPLGFGRRQTLDFSGWDRSARHIAFRKLLSGVANHVMVGASAFTNEIGMEFVRIKAGSFLMGSEKEFRDEQPVHRVVITKSFYLGKYPVTQNQWEQVMGDNPSKFKSGSTHPVERVSWNAAKRFISKLNTNFPENTYRLPTEAEWEYACRAGTTTRYFHGDDEAQLSEFAVCDRDFDEGHAPVGSRKPNAWGLYDMLGNIWEWTNDWYDDGYYKKSVVNDPQGPMESPHGEFRVMRGGSFRGLESYAVRCGRRLSEMPNFVAEIVGFRVVASQSALTSHGYRPYCRA